MDADTQEFITKHIGILHPHIEKVASEGYFIGAPDFQESFNDFILDTISDMLHDGDIDIFDAMAVSPRVVAMFFEDMALQLTLEAEREYEHNLSYTQQF